MGSGDAQVRIAFPLSGLELEALGLQLRMAEYMHEVAIVTFSGLVSLPATTGAPVWIAWGTATRANIFVGYFDHLVSDATSTTIVAVGASYPMKDAGQQIWTDTTVDQVAYEIADRYQLDADITPHDRVFPQIAQSGESDWQLLVRLAKSVGYSCYVRQAQLRFHPRTRDFLSYQSNAPIFGARDIFGFSPVSGSAVPDDSGNALSLRLLGVLEPDGEVARTTDLGVLPLAGSVGFTPSFTSVTQLPVDSIAEAFATLTAQREMTRWYITADTVVRGDVSLRPTGPVYMGNLAADNTGFWCVLSAEHRLFPSPDEVGLRYTVALKLGRDSQGQSLTVPTLDPNVRPFQLDPSTGVAEISEPTLLNGRWVARRTPTAAAVVEHVPDFVRARLANL